MCFDKFALFNVFLLFDDTVPCIHPHHSINFYYSPRFCYSTRGCYFEECEDDERRSLNFRMYDIAIHVYRDYATYFPYGEYS